MVSMRTMASPRGSIRLTAQVLLWLGAWLPVLSLVSAGQTFALVTPPPDFGPEPVVISRSALPQEAALSGSALVPQATTAPLVILPETRLPGEQSAEIGEEKPAPAAQPLSSAPQPPGPIAPTRLVIPAIGLDAPVQPVGLVTVTQVGQTYMQWQVPDGYAVGWHESSAVPGQPGNIVLNGHHNINGQVFRDLVKLKPGDVITVYAGDRGYRYLVSERHILLEKGQPLTVRLKNARWIQPTADERLTLVTCWPYASNTHRLIVVARPAPQIGQKGEQ